MTRVFLTEYTRPNPSVILASGLHIHRYVIRNQWSGYKAEVVIETFFNQYHFLINNG